MKESSGGECRHRLKKPGVQSRYLLEDILQHIEIHTLVFGDVLRLALEGLFAECLAVKTHIVKVFILIVEDFKAVGGGHVLGKAHQQAVAQIREIPAACYSGKPMSANLLENSLCYHMYSVSVG